MGSYSSAQTVPETSQPQSPTEPPKKRIPNKVIIEPKPVQFSRYVIHAKFPQSAEDGAWLLDALKRYLNKHGQNLEIKSTTQHDFIVELKTLEELGLALEYIMTNRPVHVELTITAYENDSEDSSAKSIIVFNSDCSQGLEPGTVFKFSRLIIVSSRRASYS